MVAIYRLNADDSAYQTIVPTAAALRGRLLLSIDSEPQVTAAKTWESVPYAVADGSKKQGELFSASSGNFACNRRTLETLRDCLHRDCEFLPVTILGLEVEDWFIVHPIHMVASLPALQPGTPARQVLQEFMNPQYDPAVFDRSTIFRDRREPNISACISGLGSPAEDFLVRCRELGLTGLAFKKVWER